MAHCSSSQVASKSWIRSPDETISDAEAPDQLDRSRIDAGDIGIGIARRILHRDSLRALHQCADAGFQFLPAQIDRLAARQMIECAPFRCGAPASAARPAPE